MASENVVERFVRTRLSEQRRTAHPTLENPWFLHFAPEMTDASTQVWELPPPQTCPYGLGQFVVFALLHGSGATGASGRVSHTVMTAREQRFAHRMTFPINVHRSMPMARSTASPHKHHLKSRPYVIVRLRSRDTHHPRTPLRGIRRQAGFSSCADAPPYCPLRMGRTRRSRSGVPARDSGFCPL